MSLLLDLVRHADAQPKAPGGSDHDRPLSAIGQRQVLLLVEKLRECGGYPERVWCSPAARTRATLAPFGYDFTSVATFEPRLYEAELDTLLDLVTEMRSLAARALIVAHNPGLQDLLTYLVGSEAPGMITAAYARIEVPERPQRPLRGKSRLLEFWAP